MAVTIKNLTSRPIYVSLHSGRNVRLSPGGASDPVDEVEVKNNASLEELVRQRMVAVSPAAKGSDPARTEAARTENGTADDTEARSRARKKT